MTNVDNNNIDSMLLRNPEFVTQSSEDGTDNSETFGENLDDDFWD